MAEAPNRLDDVWNALDFPVLKEAVRSLSLDTPMRFLGSFDRFRVPGFVLWREEATGLPGSSTWGGSLRRWGWVVRSWGTVARRRL